MYDAKKPSFDAISACIRLGHKYRMTTAYEQSLQYLKKHYTRDFFAWDKVTSWSPEGFAPETVIGVVNLARLIGEPSLLPTAFMACIDLGRALVDGYTREDGTLENLTLKDLGTCFQAQARLHQERVALILRVFSLPVSKECKDSSACRTAKRTALQGLHANAHLLVVADPFGDYTALVKGGNIGLCQECVKVLDDQYLDGRLRMWIRLPELLGIDVPGWVPPAEPSGV